MFDKIFEFEQALAEYTGAPYCVLTDGCTHALELCFRYDRVKECRLPAYTYLSVPMLLRHLAIDYEMTDTRWHGEYQFINTRVWDSARRLEHGMYRPGAMQCLSFGWTKPLQLGKVGAILLDNSESADVLRKMVYDGRTRDCPWAEQNIDTVGYHYYMTPETAELGLAKLPAAIATDPRIWSWQDYPDLRTMKVFDNVKS